jgi:hypothetical protein
VPCTQLHPVATGLLTAFHAEHLQHNCHRHHAVHIYRLALPVLIMTVTLVPNSQFCWQYMKIIVFEMLCHVISFLDTHVSNEPTTSIFRIIFFPICQMTRLHSLPLPLQTLNLENSKHHLSYLFFSSLCCVGKFTDLFRAATEGK